jgi:hypothetical protein
MRNSSGTAFNFVMLKFNFCCWRAAIFCGALMFLCGVGSTLRAQDDDGGEPMVAVEEDQTPPDAPTAPRVLAHEPSALERNSQKAATAVQLAQNGKALLPIVIAAQASSETKRTAEELADFLGRIAGAKFEIQTAGTLPQSGIVIGTPREYSVPELQAPLAIHGGYDGREAFAIRTSKDRVLLLGATEKAVPHAVYRFLETLGCRWLATGEHWEIVPKISDLNWNLDITDRPTVLTRVIAFMDGATRDETIDGKLYSERTATKNWTRRNNLGASLETSAGHAWHRIFAEHNDEFLAHPEYFAEVNGKRVVPTYMRAGKKTVQGVGAKLELANPRVREMCVEYAVNYFKEYPDADMVSFSPTDGGGFSQSAESQKLGSVSDAVFGMANEMARALQKAYPGQNKMIGVYAYGETSEPPTFPLEPNVYVELATLFNASQYSYDELFTMWGKAARHLGVYEYFSYFDADYALLPGARASSINYLKDKIPHYAELGLSAIFAQSSNSFGNNGRGYYLASKLMWNPNADTEAILQDFYEKAYGPAAKVMQRYHERVGLDAQPFITDVLMGAAFRDVQEATRLAKSAPDVLARLNDIKQYLHYEELWRKAALMPTKTPEEKAAYREVVVAGLRQAFAMRHTYMVLAAMVGDRMGRAPAAKIGDITLITKAKRTNAKFAKIPGDREVPNVWDGVPLQTPAEIEANFQADLAALPDVKIEEKKFDLSDLVPVEFPPSSGPATPRLSEDKTHRVDYYQDTPRYVFYSFGGEPIEVSLGTGYTPKNLSNGKWTLRKMDKSVVAEGEVPADKTPHPLSIQVPAAGAYLLEFDVRHNGATFEYSVNTPASVIYRRGSSAERGFAGMVFYVPKGTREIDYYFKSNNGGAHQFIRPDGKLSTKVEGEGVTAKIPVPPGMDGQVWRLSANSQTRVQWFYNIPNIVAATPKNLLVPRAVAEKDGLKIRKN